MGYEIEIIEGHDSSSYFWFHPVIVNDKEKITDDDVYELEEEFSIEEGDVECFLAYFFFKYFDEDLPFNKKRYYYEFDEYIKGFEWYLTYNFYTYDTMKKMTEEILMTADLLGSDYDDPRLDEIKKKFSIFYMCDTSDEDFKNGNTSAIRDHISVVIDFYRRFAARMNAMMENNKNTSLISIMGP